MPHCHPSDIILRAVEPEDVDSLYLWENCDESFAHGALRAPLSRHQLWEYAQNYDADPTRGELKLIVSSPDNRRPLGIVDLYDIDLRHGHAMVAVYVASDNRRRRFALNALKRVENYCLNVLSLSTLAAMVAHDNLPSLSLFNKAGYSQAGSLSGWLRRPEGDVDVAIFQKQLTGSAMPRQPR